MLKRYLSIFVLFALSMSFLIKSLSFLIADVHYENAQHLFNKWVSEKGINNKDEYKLALDEINFALQNNKYNAHYYDTKARILDWGIAGNFEIEANYNNVVKLFLKSTELRPYWPVTWIELAAVNEIVQGMSSDTRTYIQKALVNGYYNRHVINGILSILLLSWDNLTFADKMLFFKLLKVTSQKEQLLSKALMDAKALDKHTLVCSQIKYDKDYKDYKNKWPFTGVCAF